MSERRAPAITRGHVAALLGITAAGAALRLFQLGRFSLWYDEGATLFLRRFTAPPGQLFDIAKTTEPPLNAVLLWAWERIAPWPDGAALTEPLTDAWIRMPPALFGILCIPLIFAAARALLRDNVSALFAAALFAAAPFHVYYAQELRIYAFYTAAWLAALYCFVRALETGRPWAWCGLALCQTIALYAHFISVWTVIAFNLAFVAQYPLRRRQLARWTASQGLVVLLFLPILPTAWFMNAALDTKTIPWYPDLEPSTILYTFKAFFAAYAPVRWVYWPLFALGMGLTLLGIARLRRRPEAALSITALIFAPVLGNYVLWSARSFNFYEHRLFVFSGAVALIAAAHGLRTLAPPLRIAASAALLLLTSAALYGQYQGRLHPVVAHRIAVYDKVDLRGAAARIAMDWEPGDLIGHASHFSVYSMAHYLPGKPQLRLASSELDANIMLGTFGPSQAALLWEHGLMPLPAGRAAANARRVWFIDTFGNTFEYKPLTDAILGQLDAQWRLEAEHAFSGVRLRLYAREERPPETAQDP